MRPSLPRRDNLHRLCMWRCLSHIAWPQTSELTAPEGHPPFRNKFQGKKASSKGDAAKAGAKRAAPKGMARGSAGKKKKEESEGA